MSKIYDRFKVIDGVLCCEGKPNDLQLLADKLNLQDEVFATCAANKIKWAEEDKIRAKESKIRHDAFMAKMDERKLKAQADHDERVAKQAEFDAAGLEFLDSMKTSISKMKEDLTN